MKVIDILLDIANGEEVPKKIKVYDDIYEFDTFNKSYWNKQHKNLLELYNGYILTYKVEIIEDTPKEDKKIEKFKVIKDNSGDSVELIYDGMKLELTLLQAIILDKLNKIIDKINKEEK